MPDPSSTQLVGQPQGAPDYPWEPPAEWDPGELPAGAATTPPPTWVANTPADQVGWNTGHDTGGYSPTQPPPAQQWSGPGYPPTPPPTPPAGRRGSRTPLILGATAVVVIAAIVAVVLVVTGGKKSGTALNGVQNQNATDVLAASREALRAASSVQLTGTVFDNGSAIRLDLTLAAGNDSQGTLTINNADVQLIKIGSDVYIKGDTDFLKKYTGNNTAVLNQLNGKWLKTATTTDFDLFTLDGFAGLLKGGTGNQAVNPTVTRSTLDGQKVVVVTQKDGSTLDIANTGPALPLKLDSKGSNGGTVTFTNYNKPAAITAPPAADVFDVSTASPSPSPSPSPTPTEAAFIGAWTCTATTGTGGGNFTLNPDHSYSVVQGTDGSWGSSADHVAFAGGSLDKGAGVVTGNSMALAANGRSFSCLKH